MTTSTYTVTGMTCGHCVSAVSEEVGGLPGVTEVSVDLPTGVVTVTSDSPFDPAVVTSAVAKTGYEAVAS